MTRSCTCSKCISACRCAPGFFASLQEIKGAAEELEMPLGLFARFFLEWEDKGIDYEAICIRPKRFIKGRKHPQGFKEAEDKWTQGPCVFFQDDLCLIHPSKPLECREFLGCENKGLILTLEESCRIPTHEIRELERLAKGEKE